MLALIVEHWRSGKPIEREAANFELVQRGFPYKEVRVSRYALANRRPSALEILQGDVHARPKLAALIELGDHESEQDLRKLTRVVEAMRKMYRPAQGDLAAEELAKAAEISDEDFRRLAPLTDLYREGPSLRLDEQVMGWTSFSEFLNDRIGENSQPRARAHRAAEEELSIDFLPTNIGWKNLGPYEEATLELSPLTVLVGANGAGKTSAIRALALLRDWMRTGAEELPAEMVRGDAFEIELCIAGELHTLEEHQRRAEWRAEIAVRPRKAVRREQFFVDEKSFAALAFGAGWRALADGSREALHIGAQSLAILEAHKPKSEAMLMAVRQGISRWSIHVDDAPSYTFAGIAAAQGDEWPDITALQEAIAAVLGPTEILRNSKNKLLYKDPRGRLQHVQEAPRGISHVVKILADLMQPHPPPLLAIDEIERHLHANALERLIDVLRGFTEHTKIVLTTHSSKVLQSIAAEELRLVRSGEKASSIVNVSRDPRLKRLMETGELGALLDQGYFAEEL